MRSLRAPKSARSSRAVKKHTFVTAAEEILQRHRRPLSLEEVTEEAIRERAHSPVRQTPLATMSAKLYTFVRQHPSGPIVRVFDMHHSGSTWVGKVGHSDRPRVDQAMCGWACADAGMKLRRSYAPSDSSHAGAGTVASRGILNGHRFC
jgi:hypothetical protein